MASWTDGTDGDVTTSDVVRALHFREICAAVNRRRLLVYLAEEDFSAVFVDDTWIVPGPIDNSSSPFDLRQSIDSKILNPVLGGLGGIPPTPSNMDWLWALPDSDENKVIVASAPGAGEVSFFAKMNGGSGWTDSTLTAGTTWIRAVHVNELRWGIETLTRGRWEMPIYLSASIFSPLPDDPWVGGAIANNGSAELRAFGFAQMYTSDVPSRGLEEVTVRSSSRIYLTTDANCEVDVYRCKRPISWIANPPTWNKYDPSGGLSWQVAGCGGADDREYIGSMTMVATVENSITGAGVAAALQEIVDGAEQNFMVRRSDTGLETVGITGRLRIEFDLNVPPN